MVIYDELGCEAYPEWGSTHPAKIDSISHLSTTQRMLEVQPRPSAHFSEDR